jgi:nicotinate-nucleotide adenylyltransferase
VTGLLGGTFNPPHNGHLALARAAQEHFGLEELVVLVAERPGHKEVQLDGETRLKLARAGFPDYEVEPDPHERTVDMLRARDWSEPLFLIGADQFVDFLTWKDPEGVLALARIGVAGAAGGTPDRRDPRVEEPERRAPRSM